jgi:hypothetical protein
MGSASELPQKITERRARLIVHSLTSPVTIRPLKNLGIRGLLEINWKSGNRRLNWKRLPANPLPLRYGIDTDIFGLKLGLKFQQRNRNSHVLKFIPRMTDKEISSVDSTLVLNLRSRRVPKAETDPEKRCKIVSGWPATSKKMERLADKRQPPEADCPKYSDIDTDADDEAFLSRREAERRALEDEMEALEAEAERTRQRIIDEMRMSRLAFRARATSTPDRESEQRRPTASAPEAPVPTDTLRKVAFAQPQSALDIDKQEVRGQYVDAIREALAEAAAQLTGRQEELGVGSADSDAESIDPSEAVSHRSPGRTPTTAATTAAHG